MSITFDISTDLQARPEGISDLNLRVALYLHDEAQLEAVRRQRHSIQAREIAATAVRKAKLEKGTGFDADKSFAELRRVQQSIAERLIRI